MHLTRDCLSFMLKGSQLCFEDNRVRFAFFLNYSKHINHYTVLSSLSWMYYKVMGSSMQLPSLLQTHTLAPKGCFMLTSPVKVGQPFCCSHMPVFFPHCRHWWLLFPKQPNDLRWMHYPHQHLRLFSGERFPSAPESSFCFLPTESKYILSHMPHAREYII